MSRKNPYLLPFILVTCLFFLWGFAHNLDPILIPHLKRSFTLTTTQSTLIDSAVFIAYFLMALPAGFIMRRFGYQWGIILGLLLFAAGCFLFLPAADLQSYSYFLIALFVIACGLTILETAANPYASALGDPATATVRLNFAQSFNGLAAALAPVIGARLILTEKFNESDLLAMDEGARKLALASEAASVKGPYLTLGILLLVVAFLFSIIKLPKLNVQATVGSKRKIWHAFQHKHLTMAVVAQFFYVGAQVSVFSLFILYAEKSAGMEQVRAADYLGICGLAFLIGRFLGTFLMRYFAPERLLALYAAMNMALSLIAIFGSGIITVYAVIAICFFMSIMFPTIFSLGIRDLNEDTEFGSSLLIMSIVGGAILPRFFGLLSDWSGNIQVGFLVPLVCYAVVLFFGLTGYKVLTNPKSNQL
jgi:FHS family L-fucose permease-like MFS transporter